MESPAEETPDAPVIEPGLNGGNAPAEEPVSEEPVAAEDPVAAEAPVAEQAETASGPVDDALAGGLAAAEAVAEPEAEAVAEPEAEAVAEPEAEAAAEPEAEAVAEPKAEAEAAAEPEAEAVAEPKAEAVAEPKAEAVAEPKAEAVAEPKAEAVAEPEGESAPAEEPASEEPAAEAAPAEPAAAEDEAAAEEAPSNEMPEQVVLSGEDERALAEVLRTAIAEEAERLAASTRYAESAQGFRDLLERWKSAPSAGQMRDRELWRRFAAAREAFYEQRNRAYAERARERSATVERKEALIAESEALAGIDDGRAIGDALERLMTEWKAAGHAGRDQEQALWERFSASRRAAFDRRRSMAAERDRQRGGARAAKRTLIEQTQALIEPFDAAAAEPALARQMEEWKAAGSAGRADDEELWQAFRAARDQVLAQLRAARPPRRREGGGPSRRDGSGSGSRGTSSVPQQPPQPPVSPLSVALRKHEERVAEVEQRLAEAKSAGRSRAAEARALERKLADEQGALERARALLAFAG
jgi:Domain of Unknown Function (DUF349)